MNNSGSSSLLLSLPSGRFMTCCVFEFCFSWFSSCFTFSLKYSSSELSGTILIAGGLEGGKFFNDERRVPFFLRGFINIIPDFDMVGLFGGG